MADNHNTRRAEAEWRAEWRATTDHVQGAQTINGGFEYIEYYVFEAVDYPRLMSWKAGDGRIFAENRRYTEGDAALYTYRPRVKEAGSETLEPGWAILAMEVVIKLVRS